MITCFTCGKIMPGEYRPGEIVLCNECAGVFRGQVGVWVSVKDRKPKSMANKVLVWLEHEELVGYIGFGHYEKYKGVEMWYDLFGKNPGLWIGTKDPNMVWKVASFGSDDKANTFMKWFEYMIGLGPDPSKEDEA